jgi:hypothetical protein
LANNTTDFVRSDAYHSQLFPLKLVQKKAVMTTEKL